MRIAFTIVVLAACGQESSSTDANIAIDVPPDTPRDTAPLDGDTRAAVVGLCANVMGTPGLTAEVTDTTGYVPSINVTIKVGAVARFGYADGGTEHTIVSGERGMPDGLFASAPFMDHGTLICVRFDAPGVYPIHCDRHPTGLEGGTVTVEP
jgi:plastocyanin